MHGNQAGRMAARRHAEPIVRWRSRICRAWARRGVLGRSRVGPACGRRWAAVASATPWSEALGRSPSLSLTLRDGVGARVIGQDAPMAPHVAPETVWG